MILSEKWYPGIRKSEIFAENFGQNKVRKLVSSAALEAKKPYSAVGFDETFGVYSQCLQHLKLSGERKHRLLQLLLNFRDEWDGRKRGKRRKNFFFCAMRLFGEVFLLDINTGRYPFIRATDCRIQYLRKLFVDFNRLYGENLIHPHDRQVFL